MAIVGPTASGKSAVAMEIARRTGAEIVSVDSMQVYRGMDIGTAKPSPAERSDVPHHLLDIAEPQEPFTVAQFRSAARRALEGTEAEVILVVGGSGLHFRAVVDPMTFAPHDPGVRAEVERAEVETLVSELLTADPGAGRHVDLSNPRRVIRAVEAWRTAGVTPSERADSEERARYDAYEPEIPFTGIALDRHDPEVAVARRLERMRAKGLLEEVARLAPRLGSTASNAVGYRQLLPVVEGSMGPDDGFEDARRATMALVKRQRTFFRRDPRLCWFDADRPDLVEAVMEEAAL